MRFKKLELLGFKSFAEPTELTFEPGVTAVVGPNGCGKCLAESAELLTVDGKRWTIGALVEESLRKASQVQTLDDGFCTSENPLQVSILSLNTRTLKLEARPVSAFIKRIAPEFLLRIHTKSGREVTATPYHPLFTLKSGRLQALRADEVQVGIRIAVPRTLPLISSKDLTPVREILSAFSSEDSVYVPYSDDLRGFVQRLAQRRGGLAPLAKAAGVSIQLLRGIQSRQAIHVAVVARLVELEGRSWADDNPSLPLKSKGTGQVQIPRKIEISAARFLGYLISEGRTTASGQVWFVNEDAALVEDFRQSSREAFGVEAKVFSCKPCAKDVIIFSQTLCRVLHRLYGLAIDGVSADKRIPRQIMAAPEGVAAQFLSALFEGDAYLSDRGSSQYVEYATASEKLAQDVVTLLLRLGVVALCRPKVKYASNTEARRKRLYYSVYIYGVENLRTLARRLTFVGRKKDLLERFRQMERSSNPNLDLIPGLTPLVRHLTKTSGLQVKALRSDFPRLAAYTEGRCEVSRVGVEQVVSVARRCGIQTTETETVCQDLERLAHSDLYWDEIVSVEQVPPEGPWVYDLSVAETHNFVAENIVVHNSNIADAIKWVLGEQSARELRGGKMEDLIFNGSDRRDPIHFAEVSLTLDNSEKKLPIEYSEVTIARRLFRTGESEYLLNGSVVRLKDVSELLMGTGIGTSAYSLFEQGRIEQIINARPEERRVVFEEAAGITKYKAQKREAMRRLEETEENLARVSDVVAEVKRQMQALERQVRRARMYQEQMEELKGLEQQSARRDLAKLGALSQEKEGLLQHCRDRVTELESRAQGWENRVASARAKISQAEEAFSRAREQMLAVLHRQETARGNLEMNRERIAEGQTRNAALRQEIASAEAQTAQLEMQRSELSEAVARQEEERREKEERISLCQSRLQECARIVEEAQRSIVQARERLLEVTGSQVQAKNGLARVRQEAARLEARAGRLKMEATKVAGEQREVEEQVRSIEEGLLQHRTVFEGLEQERSVCQENLTATQSALAAAQQEVSDLAQEMARVGSRLELLKGLLTSHEGYSSGVKSLLSALDSGAVDRSGVVGVLAELIQVEQADMAAVDAALGPWAESVVVESGAVADRCRRFLEETQAGRVLFLMLDRVPSESPNPPVAPLSNGVSLVDRIGITPHLSHLLQLLLADNWLVADRESAQALMSAGSGTRARFVTPEGEFWTAASALLGSTPAEEALIVGRKSRLQSLEAAAGHCEGRLEEARARLRSLQEQQGTQAQALEVLEGILREKAEEIHRQEADCSNARATLEKLRQEQQVLRAEEQSAAGELQEIRLEVDRWEKELAGREQELESLESGIHQAQETMVETGGIREEISVELATAKTEMASFDEVTGSRLSSLQVLVQSIENARAQADSRQEDLARQEQRQVEWEAACAELEASLSRMTAEQSQAQHQVDQAERLRAETGKEAQEEERQFGVIRRRLDELQAQLHGQEMERAQVAFQREQIVSRLQQVYQIDLEKVEPPTGSDPAGLEQDPEEMRVRIEELSQRMQRMGPVNLGSIDEERDLQNRYEYLTTQQNDLLKAKEDLHEAILKINRTTRAMFRETFQAIQKEFQVTYRQLFGGGEARLVLMDEEDVLESGIEIIARPPGKALQPISLLSGGEKALTTIALLFAIFRIKPSPFCLLDEIDAPLDEPNIDRFTRALREFLQDSQFIIITHNKKTMGMADVMYGITMQEMGVSKIVSVKFKNASNPETPVLQPAR